MASFMPPFPSAICQKGTPSSSMLEKLGYRLKPTSSRDHIGLRTVTHTEIILLAGLGSPFTLMKGCSLLMRRRATELSASVCIASCILGVSLIAIFWLFHCICVDYHL